MLKATSFISEHTVELTIAPIFKKLLEQEFTSVVPIFPWMTREGGRVSRLIHKDDRFKIIGLYPRRPKLIENGKESIYLKIGEQIVLGAKAGKTLGIPIIGGLPLVRNLWELGDKPECLWMRLDLEDTGLSEYEIKYDGMYIPDKMLLNKVLTSTNEIIEVIQQQANVFDLKRALDTFKKVKISSMNIESYSNFAFMGGYKPLYFLLRL